MSDLEPRIERLETELVSIKDILLNIQSILQKSEKEEEEVPEEDLTNYSKDELKYSKELNGNEEWVDTKGNVIKFKGKDGLIIYREYDEHNNNIHYKSSNGYEQWYDYDENNRMIHSKSLDGSEKWYDVNTGRAIGKKTPKGNETWFDSIGRIIRTKYLGDEAFYEYDANDQLVSIKYSNGLETLWERNSDGITTYNKDVDGIETWFTDRGTFMRKKYPDGSEELRELRVNGEIGEFTRHIDPNGNEKLYRCNGKLIYKKDSDGNEEWYEANGNEVKVNTESSL